MFIGTHKSTLLSRAASLTVLGVLTLSALVPLGGTAAASPAAERPAAPFDSKTPPSPGVSPQPAAPDSTSRPATGRPVLKLRSKDPAGLMVNGNCMPYAYVGGSGIGYDEFLEETVGISYYGGVDCDFLLDSIYGEVGVVDRSPDFNGQSFSGWYLDSTGIFGYGYSGSGSDGVGIQARYYNGARYVEPVVDLYLTAPAGTVWDYCGWVPGMTYYACDGLGTSYLYLKLGGFTQWTGLTQACRNQSESLDLEQRRLTTTVSGSSVPASTQILGIIPSIRNLVIGFKQAMCYTNPSGASGFASTRGRQLWDRAVTEARNPGTNNDDRPLYWARLSMTAALAQWVLPSGVDKVALQRTLDRAARGMTSNDFTRGTTKKVIISGFDPFGLNGGGIQGGNPSGAAVLGLDETVVGGAEVQVVIFPVRFADFDTVPPDLGTAETVFAQHLASGPQRATMIMTVSEQPGDRFDLEFWNGRNRSEDFPDNRDARCGCSDLLPVEPGYHAPGKQFAQSTLPIESMRGVGSPYTYQVEPDYRLRQQSARGVQPEWAVSPTGTWNAVQGSGGGFLSNEVAYRVTEMRDYFGSDVKAGHVHTPRLDLPPTPARRNTIVTQYRQVLEAAIAAA